jgi:hypothetical protein
MSSASCRVQLTQVTNNLQLPGADDGLVYGLVCLKQRGANESLQRTTGEMGIGHDSN